MDLNTFKSDAEIISYLKSSAEKIVPLNECRLLREEQLQITENVFHHRNCVEWIIRGNIIIQNLKYAIIQSIAFAEKMASPIEDTENKTMYSYFLEDAVYRDIVLWDVFRQLLNEIHKCGCSESEDISIFSFLKQKKNLVGAKFSNSLLLYLNSAEHQKVRKTLRNSFTHSVESTSTYVFHRKINGKVQPKVEYMLPKHPFENINAVIDDVHKLLNFMKSETDMLMQNLISNIALYRVAVTFPCGKCDYDDEPWSLSNINENSERIISPCSLSCDNAHLYNGKAVCKPIKVEYCRINGQANDFFGIINLQMSFSEIEKAFRGNS